MLVIVTFVAGLAIAGIFYLIWNLYKQKLMARIKLQVYIHHSGDQLSIHTPKLTRMDELLLGRKDLENLKRSLESRVLKLEPIIEEVQRVVQKRKQSGVGQKNLFFTAGYPPRVPVEAWRRLMVYMHTEPGIESFRDEAVKSADPASPFSQRAANKKDNWSRSTYRITLLPEAPGVRFNPALQSLWSVEDYDRVPFNFQGGPELTNRTVSGQITAYIGLVELTRIPFEITFGEPASSPESAAGELQFSQGKIYQRIFASFASDDREVTESVVKTVTALGDDVLMQCLTHRDGKDWQSEMKSLIDQAEVFQLFWSDHAARSARVKQEYTYALQRAGGNRNFIRLIYWHTPVPKPPSPLQHLSFCFHPFKQR